MALDTRILFLIYIEVSTCTLRVHVGLIETYRGDQIIMGKWPDN